MKFPNTFQACCAGNHFADNRYARDRVSAGKPRFKWHNSVLPVGN